jgi:hypothetical protein
MRRYLALALLLTGCSLRLQADSKMLSVVEQSGAVYVTASELERQVSVAVKSLPGEDTVAVCSGRRCAPVKEWLRKNGEILVSIAAVEQALGLSTKFSADRHAVEFVAGTANEGAETRVRVGQLAPNFRLARLDGGSMSLSDFRGKRVLINSGGSW